MCIKFNWPNETQLDAVCLVGPCVGILIVVVCRRMVNRTRYLGSTYNARLHSTPDIHTGGFSKF